MREVRFVGGESVSLLAPSSVCISLAQGPGTTAIAQAEAAPRWLKYTNQDAGSPFCCATFSMVPGYLCACVCALRAVRYPLASPGFWAQQKKIFLNPGCRNVALAAFLCIGAPGSSNANRDPLAPSLNT